MNDLMIMFFSTISAILSIFFFSAFLVNGLFEGEGNQSKITGILCLFFLFLLSFLASKLI